MRSDDEMKNLKKFVADYGIKDIKILTEERYKFNPPDSYAFTAQEYLHYQTELINFYNLSIPENSLDKLVNIITEFEELMRDPESAKLLMEARFINRLKRGKY